MTNTRSTRSGAQAPQAVDYSRCPEPAPFLKKTYEMVSDPELEKIISWSPDGESFTVWNHSDFENKVLPMKFKHQNFSSFVRQLNTYNFRKSDPTAWQFSNKYFKRGKPEELHLIKRKTKQSALDNTIVPGNAAIEVGSFGGIVDEVEGLKRDKNVLMLELVRLRQQQQAAEAEIKQMRAKVEKTEQGQQQIMGFLTQAVNNPAFLHQLLNARQSNNRVTEEGRKKRRAVRPGDKADTSKAIITYQPQEEDFSTSFLSLLQREGHHSLERSANPPLPANASAGMEIEGLSDDDMSTPDLAGLNFDHLNLSPHQPVRSAVTINEHLPQDVPSLDDILQQPLQTPQSTALPPPSFPPSSMNASDPFSPSNAAATDFGMPEIMPSEQLSSADLLSPMGPPLTSASPNDFAYSTGMPAIPGTSPFASSSAQAEGAGQMLDLGSATDFTLGDGSEVSQEIWKMLNGSSSLNGELPPWPQDMSGVSEGLPVFNSSGFNDDLPMPDSVQQAPVRAG